MISNTKTSRKQFSHIHTSSKSLHPSMLTASRHSFKNTQTALWLNQYAMVSIMASGLMQTWMTQNYNHLGLCNAAMAPSLDLDQKSMDFLKKQHNAELHLGQYSESFVSTLLPGMVSQPIFTVHKKRSMKL